MPKSFAYVLEKSITAWRGYIPANRIDDLFEIHRYISVVDLYALTDSFLEQLRNFFRCSYVFPFFIGATVDEHDAKVSKKASFSH